MTSKTHTPKILFFIIAVIGLLLILISSTEQPIQEIREEKPAEIEQLSQEIIEEPVEEVQEEIAFEEEPEEEIIEEKPIPKTFITDEKCENGIISLTLNNLYDDTLNVAWSTFFISGQINPTPGCDKASLQPGESTYCSNVGGHAWKGRRRVAIALYKHTTVGVTVDCSSNLVTGSYLEEVPYYNFNFFFFFYNALPASNHF